MIKYKEVDEITKVGYEVCRGRFGYTSYYKDGEYHRIDGPAVHKEDNTYEKYYLDGVHMSFGDRAAFVFLLTCDLKDVPPYLGSILDPVAKNRLEKG